MQRRPLKKRCRISGNLWMLLFIIALFSAAIWVLTPSGSAVLDREKENLGMRLGLDLKGGTQIAYQAAFLESETNPEGALAEAANRIRTRIDEYGVIEPAIQTQGIDRIIIQLPGITDPAEVQDYILQPAFLEFREVEMNAGSLVTLGDYLNK